MCEGPPQRRVFRNACHTRIWGISGLNTSFLLSLWFITLQKWPVTFCRVCLKEFQMNFNSNFIHTCQFCLPIVLAVKLRVVIYHYNYILPLCWQRNYLVDCPWISAVNSTGYCLLRAASYTVLRAVYMTLFWTKNRQLLCVLGVYLHSNSIFRA